MIPRAIRQTSSVSVMLGGQTLGEWEVVRKTCGGFVVRTSDADIDGVLRANGWARIAAPDSGYPDDGWKPAVINPMTCAERDAAWSYVGDAS